MAARDLNRNQKNKIRAPLRIIPNVPHVTYDLSNVPPEYRDEVARIYAAIDKHMAVNGTPYKWSMKDFQIGAPMGRGKFGRVYLAREKTTGYMVAIKMLYKSELLKHNMQHQLIREIEIQMHLEHKYVLRMLTYFSDKTRIYLVLEFAGGGELFRVLQDQPLARFPEDIAAKYIEQIAEAITYCHSHKVIHRDIKPENILIDVAGDLKLADFGWSVHSPSRKRHTFCGTIDYLPPELVEDKAYNEYVDHWCIGVLCYELLVGHTPFESKTQKDTFEKIKQVKFEYPSYMSSGAQDLIGKLLKKNREERMEVCDVKNHPWIVAMRKKREELAQGENKKDSGGPGPSASGCQLQGQHGPDPNTSGHQLHQGLGGPGPSASGCQLQGQCSPDPNASVHQLQGQVGSGSSASGHQLQGQDGPGRGASGHQSQGQVGSGSSASGHQLQGQGGPGPNASGHQLQGQDGPGRGASGHQLQGLGGPGPSASGHRLQGQNGPDPNASVDQLQGQDGPDPNASGHQHQGQVDPGSSASGHQLQEQDGSGPGASAHQLEGQVGPGPNASGHQHQGQVDPGSSASGHQLQEQDGSGPGASAHQLEGQVGPGPDASGLQLQGQDGLGPGASGH